MRLAIFGATGATGKAVVEQALASGHEVTAVLRDPARLPLSHARLAKVRANIFSLEEVEPVVAGHDAVVSCLGAKQLGATTFYSETGRVITEAMRRQGVKRLVCMTSAGVEDDDPSFGFFYRVFLKDLLLRNIYDDCKRLESLLRTTPDVEWTVVRPGYLTNAPGRGDYRVSPRFLPPPRGRSAIARADVAAFMLSIASNGGYVHGTPTLSY